MEDSLSINNIYRISPELKIQPFANQSYVDQIKVHFQALVLCDSRILIATSFTANSRGAILPTGLYYLLGYFVETDRSQVRFAMSMTHELGDYLLARYYIETTGNLEKVGDRLAVMEKKA